MIVKWLLNLLHLLMGGKIFLWQLKKPKPKPENKKTKTKTKNEYVTITTCKYINYLYTMFSSGKTTKPKYNFGIAGYHHGFMVELFSCNYFLHVEDI